MAWAGAFPPFSFCAAIISCLLRSASSIAFFTSIHGLGWGFSTFFLLCSHHFLPLTFRIFHSFLLFKGLSFLLFSFLLTKLFFFSSLLLCKFFLLLYSDLFPLGLLLLQPF